MQREGESGNTYGSGYFILLSDETGKCSYSRVDADGQHAIAPVVGVPLHLCCH